MYFKVRGGTSKGGCSETLCKSCSSCTRAQGENQGQDVIYCHALRQRMRFPVRECNAYKAANQPDLWNMQQIAWNLCVDKKGNKIGFLSPDKTEEAVAGGKAAPLKPVIADDDL